MRVFFSALLISICCNGMVSAQDPLQPSPVTPDRKITLQETLEKGLKVRTKTERAFVIRIVKLVNQKKLTERMVKAAMYDARKRHKKLPYYYFRVIMIELAKTKRVKLS